MVSIKIIHNIQSMGHTKLSIQGSIIIGAIIIGVAIIIAFGNRNTTNKITPRITIEQAAKKVGVKQEALLLCVDEKRYAEKIDIDIENAQAVKLQGTPHSIVIGRDGTTIGLSGALPLTSWESVLTAFKDKTLTVPAEDPAKNVRPVDATDHVRGSSDPDITIVEYSDLDCPFCHKLHATLLMLLDQHDNIQWVYRHTPITSLHPDAYRKALASECVYELSGNNETKFWKFVDLLMIE